VPACVCCYSPGAQFGKPPNAPNGLPVAAQSLCGICTKHQGSHPHDLERRNRQHLEQWQLDFEQQQQMYEAAQAKRDVAADKAVAELRATIEKLKDEIRSRPVQLVERNLDQEKVDEAIRERDIYNAARVRAYKTLSRLRVVHHDAGDGRCTCGTSMARCAATEILDGDRSFLRWEVRQVDRIRSRGPYESALPEGHPAIIDPRWSPPGETTSGAKR
jgi:hypothetical protein